MTEHSVYSRLHDITLPLESKVSGGVNTYKTQLRRGDYVSHETTNPLVVNIQWLIEEERVVNQLRELAKGGINIVQLGCLAFDELVHIQNMRARETGGVATQWIVQGEFNLVGVTWTWMVDGEEIESEWDNVVSDSFTQVASVPINEGNEGIGDAPDDYTWYALGGNWNLNISDFMYCPTLIRTHAIALVVKDELQNIIPATADGDFSADVYLGGGAGAKAGLAIRMQKYVASAYGTGYVCYADEDTETIVFAKNRATTTTVLKDWVVTAFTTSTYYQLRVIARGNRFDVFWLGKHLGTAYDKTYNAGWHGVMVSETNCQIDNYLWKLAKPVVVQLPMGVYDVNRIRMPVTTRMNDDITADGLNRILIAGNNPIKFRQQALLLNDPSIHLYFPLQRDFQDYSGNDKHLVVKTAHWVDSYGWTKYAKRFDGVDDFMDTDEEVTMNGDHSCMVLFRCFGDGNDKSKSYYTIVAYTDGNTGSGFDNQIFIFIERDTGYLGARTGNSTTDDVQLQHTRDLRDGQWHMVVITRDPNNNTLSMYLDGTLVESDVDTLAVVQLQATGYFDIGEWQAYNNHFWGDISTIVVWNRVLSVDEVKTLYEQLQLNASTGGEVKVWDTMGEDGLWDYLEFHVRLNEGTGSSVYDSSKNNRTVTEVSWATADWSAASYNKWAKSCYHFDGAADYFYITVDGVDTAENGHTIGGWVNFDAVSKTHDLIMGYDVTAAKFPFYMQFQSNNKMRIGIQGATTNASYDTTSWTGTALTWYFFVATWDGILANNPKFYVNGEEVVLTDVTAPTGAVDIDRFYVGGGAGTFFDGYADDVFYFNKVLDTDRIKWLYENMPRMVDETQWERVTESGHSFVGNMVIDNGMIRVAKNWRVTPDISNNYYHMIGLCPYADGIWEDPRLFIEYYDTNGHWMSDDAFQSEWILKKLTKYKVVVTQRIENGNSWLNHDMYVLSGVPFLNIKITDWSLEYNLRTSSFTPSVIGTTKDYAWDQAPRFSLTTLDTMADSIFTEGGIGGELEGLTLAFSTQNNYIWMFWDQDSSDGWGSYDSTIHSIMEMYNTAAINIVDDSPPHWWGIGFLPFKTSMLHYEAEDGNVVGTATMVDISGTQTVSESPTAAPNDAARVNDNLWANRWYTSLPDLPHGSYRVFYRMKAVSVEATSEIIVYNNSDARVLLSRSVTVLTGSWNWHCGDFVWTEADDGDDVQLMVYATDNDDIWIDQVVVWPIANSKNFPLDVRNHAMMINDITELGG